jgi:hypothetical protein
VKAANNIEKQRRKILLEMYKSVDRMNLHYSNGNNQGVTSETSLQTNLRRNFNELDDDNRKNS